MPTLEENATMIHRQERRIQEAESRLNNQRRVPSAFATEREYRELLKEELLKMETLCQAWRKELE